MDGCGVRRPVADMHDNFVAFIVSDEPTGKHIVSGNHAAVDADWTQFALGNNPCDSGCGFRR